MNFFQAIFLIYFINSCLATFGYFKIESNVDITNQLSSYVYQFNSLDIVNCLRYCLNESQCAYVATINQTLCRFLNSSANNFKIASTNSIIYRNQFTNTFISSRNNSFGINWGVWGPLETCDENDYVVGFRTKRQLDQGSGDDTSLNGIELVCRKGKNH